MTGVIPGFEDFVDVPSLEAEARAQESDHSEREDSPTPGPLAAELLAAAMLGPTASRWHYMRSQILRSECVRVVDVCAGYGVWAQRMRALLTATGVGMHITGVEIFAAREAHLRKWCDEIAMDDWQFAVQQGHFVGGLTHHGWDIAIGNPHFTALAPSLDPSESMPAILLDRAPAVMLYHTVNAFQRGDKGRAVARALPPVARWLVPGTVAHGGTSEVASDCYALSLWLRGHEGPTELHMLEVEAEDVNRRDGLLKRDGQPYRCWRWRDVPPGSEEPSEELPAAPGWNNPTVGMLNAQ